MSKSKVIFSIWKAVKNVVIFEVVVPTSMLTTIICVKLISWTNNSTLVNDFNTFVDKPIEHASNQSREMLAVGLEFEDTDKKFNILIKEVGIFSLYCFHLAMKIGLSLLLWSGVKKKSVGKLLVWCFVSGVITCIGLILCICMIFIHHNHSDPQNTDLHRNHNKQGWSNCNINIAIVTVPSTIELILYFYSVCIVILFIRRIRLGLTTDYDEYMSVSFTPRCQSVTSL